MNAKIALCALVGILFAGCTASDSPRSLYHWDSSYSTAIYEYLNEEGDIGAHIASLENLAQKAYESGQRVPPGLYAHLGLLYSNQGNQTQAKAYFDKEVKEFPESREYIAFLLGQNKKFSQDLASKQDKNLNPASVKNNKQKGEISQNKAQKTSKKESKNAK